jgi:alkanesulfonate monooxygenase SsuD/methylene tetrahydromethanopterin reductase-like flavin-dependent oxidoreductase (luciferase family)
MLRSQTLNRRGTAVGKPSFGIFDHIEDIPGTPTPQLFKDRLELIKMADEAGFASFHLAEHHGSDLCMAPNQEVFIAAASQVTENIRLGPMVKLLPLHHPVQIIEDMCVVDNLTGGRLDFGVGRGVAPIEHYWFGSNWPDSTDRFTDVLGIIADAFASGEEISSENSKYYDFPTMPLSTKPIQNPIPFWYPGNPKTAGRHGLNLMWPGPIDQAAYDVYAETWHEHKGDRIRMEGPDGAPRVGCTMLLAIAPTEDEALDIARRGMTGLTRRAHNVHRHDHLVLPEEECEAALGPLNRIMEHIEDAINAGAGTPSQIAERFAAILEPGLTDYIVLQLPTGDMTLYEAQRTMELFITEVQPQLEGLAQESSEKAPISYTTSSL